MYSIMITQLSNQRRINTMTTQSALNNSSLTNLLNYIDLGAFLSERNFTAFKKIETALLADNKTVMDEGNGDAYFHKPLVNTDDVHENQNMFLHSLISGWVNSVTQPLIEELTDAINSDTSGLAIYLDGDLESAELYFDSIDEFLAEVEPDEVDEVKEVLEDWSNTIAIIANSDLLVSGLPKA